MAEPKGPGDAGKKKRKAEEEVEDLGGASTRLCLINLMGDVGAGEGGRGAEEWGGGCGEGKLRGHCMWFVSDRLLGEP